MTGRLDELIHQPVRLRVMATLVAAGGRRRLDFTFLRDQLELTDGNLGAHLRKLEDADYVEVTKTFVGRKPRTYVRATAAEGMDWADVLRACFPAGTVSGAPKIRAMEWIAKLEPERRGLYAGAVGYIDFSGNRDTCIAIRTMVVRDQEIYIQAGAGIVADSDPALEFEETENKARALKQAMLIAAEGLL